MTMILDVENYPISGNQDKLGHALIKIRDTLLARGWTVVGSGDGGANFAREGQTSGPYDVFTASPAYYTGTGNWYDGAANTISRAAAWVILKEPSPSTREIAFQRYSTTSAAGMMWLNKLIFSASGFQQSGCSATVVNTTPVTAGTAANVIASNAIFMGNGTSETPVSADGYIMQMLVSDSARADNVWPFFVWWWNQTDGNRGGELVYESLTNAPGNERWIIKGAVGPGGAFATPTTVPTTWYGRGESALTVVNTLSMVTYTCASQLLPGAHTTGQIVTADGKVRGGYPVIFYNSDFSFKGVSEHLLVNPRNRDYPSTVDVATADAKISLGCMLLPWKQNTTPSF